MGDDGPQIDTVSTASQRVAAARPRHPGATMTPPQRERLIMAHLPLVRSLARRYLGRGESLEDLVQVGSEGLIKAIDRFDPERGVTLATFATPTILGEIRHHFRDRIRAIHVPRSLQDAQANVARATNELSASSGRTPTVRELAAHLECDDEYVLDALAASTASRPLSFSGMLDADGDERAVDVAVEDGGFERAEGRASVGRAFKRLPERERLILHLWLDESLTQAQIAERVGISQMHVSRLIRRAIVTLQRDVGVTDGTSR